VIWCAGSTDPDTPGAHPVTSIAALNLKDFKDFAGYRRVAAAGAVAWAGSRAGAVVSGCGERGRGGDSSRACPAAQARERLPRVPSTLVTASAVAGRFPCAPP
jgi:hypothetical protein